MATQKHRYPITSPEWDELDRSGDVKGIGGRQDLCRMVNRQRGISATGHYGWIDARHLPRVYRLMRSAKGKYGGAQRMMPKALVKLAGWVEPDPAMVATAAFGSVYQSSLLPEPSPPPPPKEPILDGPPLEPSSAPQPEAACVTCGSPLDRLPQIGVGNCQACRQHALDGLIWDLELRLWRTKKGDE